jgi:hypothetical protein
MREWLSPKQTKYSRVGGAYYPIPGGGYIATTNVGSSNANGLEVGLKGEWAPHLRWSLNDRPETIADHLIPPAQNANAYVDYQHTAPTHLNNASANAVDNFPTRWRFRPNAQHRHRRRGGTCKI